MVENRAAVASSIAIIQGALFYEYTSGSFGL